MENKRQEFIGWTKLLPILTSSLSNFMNSESNSQLLSENIHFFEILNFEKNLQQSLIRIHSEKNLYFILLEELYLKFSILIDSNSKTTIISTDYLIETNNISESFVDKEIDLKDLTILLLNDIDNYIGLTTINLIESVIHSTIPKSLEIIHQIRFIGLQSLLKITKSQSIDSNIRLRFNIIIIFHKITFISTYYFFL